jgi:hypothetical protein
LKALGKRIGTVHVEIDTHFVIYDEHRQAAENGGLGFTVRSILDNIEQKVRAQVREQLVALGVCDEERARMHCMLRSEAEQLALRAKVTKRRARR